MGTLTRSLELAECFEHGYGCKVSYQDAERWYKKAAEASVEAMVRLGRFYEGGRGSRRTMPEALRWYDRAAKRGSVEAMLILGDHYGRGIGGITQSNPLEVAMHWYTQAAEAGSVRAKACLGAAYWKGTGVPVNREKAAALLAAAAAFGNYQGHVQVGLFYLYGGGGIEKNEPEAVRWFKKAADAGDADGQFNLGHCYMNGTGVDLDRAEAVRLLGLASQKGHKTAHLLLRQLGGVPVQRDAAAK